MNRITNYSRLPQRDEFDDYLNQRAAEQAADGIGKAIQPARPACNTPLHLRPLEEAAERNAKQSAEAFRKKYSQQHESSPLVCLLIAIGRAVSSTLRSVMDSTRKLSQLSTALTQFHDTQLSTLSGDEPEPIEDAIDYTRALYKKIADVQKSVSTNMQELNVFSRLVYRLFIEAESLPSLDDLDVQTIAEKTHDLVFAHHLTALQHQAEKRVRIRKEADARAQSLQECLKQQVATFDTSHKNLASEFDSVELIAALREISSGTYDSLKESIARLERQAGLVLRFMTTDDEGIAKKLAEHISSLKRRLQALQEKTKRDETQEDIDRCSVPQNSDKDERFVFAQDFVRKALEGANQVSLDEKSAETKKALEASALSLLQSKSKRTAQEMLRTTFIRRLSITSQEKLLKANVSAAQQVLLNEALAAAPETVEGPLKLYYGRVAKIALGLACLIEQEEKKRRENPPALSRVQAVAQRLPSPQSVGSTCLGTLQLGRALLFGK